MSGPAWTAPVLERSFYSQPTLQVAQGLLGAVLVCVRPEGLLAGRIVETEAYIGMDDPACHAAAGLTNRNAVMFGEPGFAYVYFIYGVYYCLNAVTEPSGFPAAVLIRALEPLHGLPAMRQQRRQQRVEALTSGPGKLCQAFSLNRSHNGLDLCAGELTIRRGGHSEPVATSARIGIRVGLEQHWRFFLQGNPCVSRR